MLSSASIFFHPKFHPLYLPKNKNNIAALLQKCRCLGLENLVFATLFNGDRFVSCPICVSLTKKNAQIFSRNSYKMKSKMVFCQFWWIFNIQTKIKDRPVRIVIHSIWGMSWNFNNCMYFKQTGNMACL